VLKSLTCWYPGFLRPYFLLSASGSSSHVVYLFLQFAISNDVYLVSIKRSLYVDMSRRTRVEELERLDGLALASSLQREESKVSTNNWPGFELDSRIASRPLGVVQIGERTS
jgi:hypothetical protein